MQRVQTKILLTLVPTRALRRWILGLFFRAGLNIGVTHFVAAHLLFFAKNALCHNLKAP